MGENDEALRSRWVPCEYCHRFTHYDCEKREAPEALEAERYACPTCRNLKKLPKPAKEIDPPKSSEAQMIDGLLVVIRPYDRAPKKFDEVGEVKIVKKTAHRPSVSTKRPRSADGKSSRTARVLKSSSSEKEKKKLPLSSNAPRRAVSKSIRGGKPTGLASLAKVATRVLPERMVRSEAYKRAQAAEEAKEEELALSTRRSGRAPKELAKAAGQDFLHKPRHQSRPSQPVFRSGVRQQSTVNESLYAEPFYGQHGGLGFAASMEARLVHNELSPQGVLYPEETGGMVGPLRTLGMGTKTPDQPFVRRPPLAPKQQRGSPKVPDQLTSSTVKKSIRRESGGRAEEHELMTVASQLIEAQCEAYDQYTVTINVCRLLNKLDVMRGYTTRDMIVKFNLHRIVGDLLMNDDIRIRLAADKLLKIPSWREAICGNATPQRSMQLPVMPTHQPFASLQAAPSMEAAAPPTHIVSKPVPRRPRAPREAKAMALMASQSSPTETITPPQTQYPYFETASQDVADIDNALLLSGGQDASQRMI